MSGTEYPGGSPDAARPRQRDAAAGRIGWLTANRLLNGRDTGPGAEPLRTLIALAAAPDSGPVAHPEALLTAFRESAAAPPSPSAAGTATRDRPAAGSLVLRFAAAVLLVLGAGTAAASVGVLPDGMQRMAHDYLGVGSDPAPSTQAPSSSTSASRTPATSGQATRPQKNGAVPTSALIALCRRITDEGGSDWRTHLSAAEQATLIAAAGNGQKVNQYCDGLLHAGGAGAGQGQGSGQGPSATPDAKASSHESATPSPEATNGPPSLPANIIATPTRGDARTGHPPTPTPRGTSYTIAVTVTGTATPAE